MAIVYRHIRLDTKKPIYIGIGKTEKRAYSKQDRNPHWNNIVAKTDYRVEILFRDLTWEEACAKEKEFIKLYGRIDLGTGILCNKTDGGDGTYGCFPNELIRKKMSESHSGSKNAFFGKEHTNETKYKLSIIKRKQPKPHISIRKNCNKPWRVCFRRNGSVISLGRFYSEQEAQEAINKWLVENQSKNVLP